jgi:hypothetical protein
MSPKPMVLLSFSPHFIIYHVDVKIQLPAIFFCKKELVFVISPVFYEEKMNKRDTTVCYNTDKFSTFAKIRTKESK